MKKIIFFCGFVFLLFSCNNLRDKNIEDFVGSDSSTKCLTVSEIFEHGDSLTNKTINIAGLVDHVCKHTGKRFKIIGDDSNLELKVELDERFSTVDPSIVGRRVVVTGKLVSVQMDAEMVAKMMEKHKENHKGEENTEHYKEELVFVQNIYNQLINAEIPFYITYYIQADKYVF